MNLQDLIRQQKATVQMLESLVGARRASQMELDGAKARLADLEAQRDFKPLPSASPRVDQPQAYAPELEGPTLSGDEYARLQAEMSADADRLNRKMAGLSNQLYQVPDGVACPELTGPILDLKAQIEAIWDRKRYLERNRRLPEEKAEASHDAGLPQLPGDDPERYQLAYQKRRLIDQKSKLKKKLANPKAKLGKRAEWERELAECELKIQEMDFKLS
ncbi:hypothetical protein FAES_2291 [Fibrella aestuarina BUZ 2]|uniref:Uncharacterized protein n=1 Tax=Fibrella aestuarina BUZ 2 TaxID=1166018 RepID=I0K847_9BACT|nr:hypothetical protein [Fibrella aestuarina]CCH00300.1 hypothetical protein FAES_2291 [Fibrella aestuarina BUZ 2]